MKKTGKLGIVRVTGKDMAGLRKQVWERDKGKCQICGSNTFWGARFDGDLLAYDLAHIKSRGAGGSDELSNCRVLCHLCHMKEHAGR